MKYTEEKQNEELKQVLHGQKWICEKCDKHFYTKAQIYVSCPKCGSADCTTIE